MGGKLNDKYNIISNNLKNFRIERGFSQQFLCDKLELLGITLYKADIYSIEHNKRTVKDFELFAFSKVLEKPISDFFTNVHDFD